MRAVWSPVCICPLLRGTDARTCVCIRVQGRPGCILSQPSKREQPRDGKRLTSLLK
eukprot:bmy_11624T0